MSAYKKTAFFFFGYILLQNQNQFELASALCDITMRWFPELCVLAHTFLKVEQAKGV